MIIIIYLFNKDEDDEGDDEDDEKTRERHRRHQSEREIYGEKPTTKEQE